MRKVLLGLASLVLAWHGLSAQSSDGWGPAQWIWDAPEANTVTQNNEPRYFRIRFELAAEPVKGSVWITADNEYVAYINGIKLGGDREWGTTEKFDVVKHLKKGTNLLAFEAKNHGGVAGAIARVHVETADKKTHIVATGDKTKVTRGFTPDWYKLDASEVGWNSASTLGDATIGPWSVAGGGNSAKFINKKSGKSYEIHSDGKIKERLSPAEQLKHFVVPKDFVVELVVADPLVINPVTMTHDDHGRMLVSESHTYRYGPSGSPVKPFKNPVIRLDPSPDGKGYTRTLVADGFDDPAMGLAVKDGKLWVAANDYLYVYDYPAKGPATNKKLLVKDKHKAWNPFGDFVLEFGPDGLLYMSVGNHNIALEGPTNKLTSRGSSGIVARMNPDGSNMQSLVQGLRVPYSFEFDPFGQLWVLSNGEGNPNRFVRVLPEVDYHCYSRPKVDNNWLAGNHPLAPPSFELPRGAHTQLMRYYGAAYPKEYVGSMLLCNWGAHGFHGSNRAIFRFVPDENLDIGLKEPFVGCMDPHFRPSHIDLDAEGNLLIADWYGRDDESDMTGRIWRVRYVGKDPVGDANKLNKDSVLALGSASHRLRHQASEYAIRKASITELQNAAAEAKEPLGAANALWCLARIGSPEAKAALVAGTRHASAPVRRLALDLMRRYEAVNTAATASKLLSDANPMVQLEAALTLGSPEKSAAALTRLLQTDLARDPHLRYQAASCLAAFCDPSHLSQLLHAKESESRLAGMIAIDVACWENHPTKKHALDALEGSLQLPAEADLNHLIFLVQQHGDKGMLPSLEKLLGRADLPVAATGRVMILYRSLAGSLPPVLGKRFLEAVQKGAITLNTPSDHLALLDLLEAEGPTPFALDQLARQIRTNSPQVRPAALALARRFGAKSEGVAEILWPSLFAAKVKAEDALDTLATIATVQTPTVDAWRKLLATNNPLLRTDAVRWARTFKGKALLIEMLAKQAPDLIKADGDLADDLDIVLGQLDAVATKTPKFDKDALAKFAFKAYGDWSATQKRDRALLGKQVFERAACVKCHTTVTQNTPLAPSLKGVGTQKLDYLVESVLQPSKVIKTGFESETITTSDGKQHSGLVKDEGTHLRLLNLDKDLRIAKRDVEQRTVQKISIMPEGQETQISRREFADLIAYLASLK